jgi:hypothetical protein
MRLVASLWPALATHVMGPPPPTCCRAPPSGVAVGPVPLNWQSGTQQPCLQTQSEPGALSQTQWEPVLGSMSAIVGLQCRFKCSCALLVRHFPPPLGVLIKGIVKYLEMRRIL